MRLLTRRRLLEQGTVAVALLYTPVMTAKANAASATLSTRQTSTFAALLTTLAGDPAFALAESAVDSRMQALSQDYTAAPWEGRDRLTGLVDVLAEKFSFADLGAARRSQLLFSIQTGQNGIELATRLDDLLTLIARPFVSDKWHPPLLRGA